MQTRKNDLKIKRESNRAEIQRPVRSVILSLLVSLGIVAMGTFGIGLPQHHAERIISNIDYNKTLLHGMLAFLLFADACISNSVI